MLGIQPLREDRRRVCSLLVWLSAGSVQFQCPNPMLANFARIRHPNVQTVWTKQAIHDSLCLQMPKGHIKFVKYSRWQLEACLIQKCLPRFLTVSRNPSSPNLGTFLWAKWAEVGEGRCTHPQVTCTLRPFAAARVFSPHEPRAHSLGARMSPMGHGS